jgi:Uma2 family endonuclease
MIDLGVTAMVSQPPEIALPPTQDELPWDDGVPMESQRHKLQMDLLLETLQPWLAERDHGYVGGNMFLYYSLAQVRNRDFMGPDVFAVVGVPKGERKSWVMWEEGKGPDVVIELLSESTADYDKTEKKRLYEGQVRVPEYFWFDPFNPEDWAGFRLQGGCYEPLAVDGDGALPSQRLGLRLVRWGGCYQDIQAVWLRWMTAAGTLLPTKDELREQEHQRAEQEKQRAELASQRAERLAAQLRALGVEPEGGVGSGE